MSSRALIVLLSLWAAPALAQVPADPSGPADGTAQLTLQEAEQRALDRNPSIASARLGVSAATYRLAETRAAYGPLFSATLSQRSQTSPATSQLSGGQEVTAGAMTFGTQISQPLQWGGGQLSVDFSGSRNATSNAFATYNPSVSSGVTVSFVQPLLRGFRFDATRAEIQQADISSDIADVELRQEIAVTLARVRRAYWELAYAADALEAARQSEALARQQLQDNRQRLALGTVAAVDVLETEAEVAARHQAVVSAEGTWRTAQVTLKQLMAVNTADPIWSASLAPVDRPAEGNRILDVPAAIAKAVASRSDVQTARSRQAAAGTNVKLLADLRKPSVNLVAEYGLNGIGGTEILRQTGALGSQILGTNPGSYLDVLRSIGGLDYPTWSVGLNVTLPIGNRAAEAAVARARTEERQVEAGIQVLELAIAAQVTRIAEEVRTAAEEVQAAAVARELAQKRLEAEEARRAAGLSTSFLVLQAQRDLATARTVELRAALDYRTALADFDLAQEAPI